MTKLVKRRRSVRRRSCRKPASQRQAGGKHYKNFTIQPAEFCKKNGIGFIEGNIIKYICRHKEKGGAKDIKKLIHMAELILEWEYNEQYNKEDID